MFVKMMFSNLWRSRTYKSRISF